MPPRRALSFAGLALLICLALSSLPLITACRKSTEIVDNQHSLDSLYSMSTDSALIMISDSGATQYKIEAAKWYIYSRGENNRWWFPEGFYFEKFDSLKQKLAEIKSDTAFYYTDRELWEFIGNVRVQNLKGDKFLSQRLFWDREKKEVYSDEPIEIITPERTLRGDRFRADQDFNEYTFYNNRGQTVVEDP